MPQAKTWLSSRSPSRLSTSREYRSREPSRYRGASDQRDGHDPGRVQAEVVADIFRSGSENARSEPSGCDGSQRDRVVEDNLGAAVKQLVVVGTNCASRTWWLLEVGGNTMLRRLEVYALAPRNYFSGPIRGHVLSFDTAEAPRIHTFVVSPLPAPEQHRDW